MHTRPREMRPDETVAALGWFPFRNDERESQSRPQRLVDRATRRRPGCGRRDPRRPRPARGNRAADGASRLRPAARGGSVHRPGDPRRADPYHRPPVAVRGRPQPRRRRRDLPNARAMLGARRSGRRRSTKRWSQRSLDYPSPLLRDDRRMCSTTSPPIIRASSCSTSTATITAATARTAPPTPPGRGARHQHRHIFDAARRLGVAARSADARRCARSISAAAGSTCARMSPSRARAS